MPRDRHKGEKIQFWLSDYEIRRFDKLTHGCKTDKERFLKLMEMAEAGNEDSRALRNKVKTLESQIDKLLKDAKQRIEEDEEVRTLHQKIEILEGENRKLKGELEEKNRKIKKLEHSKPSRILNLSESLRKLETVLDDLDRMLIPSIIEIMTDVNTSILSFQ